MHAVSATPSSEQRKVTPASLSEKANAALVLLTKAGGPAVMLGTGGATESWV